ncbi:MAG: hypothetical protein AB1633_00485 [Elusimicrobiota bacterium]
MKTVFLLILSIVLFITGISYLYYPEILAKMFHWLKEKVFNEKKIQEHRKKTGIILVFFSFLIFYFNIIIPKVIYNSDESSLKRNLNLAWYYYYKGRYREAERISLSILEKEINNPAVLEQICMIYFSQGDYRKAKFYCLKVLQQQPRNKRMKNVYEKIIEKLKV